MNEISGEKQSGEPDSNSCKTSLRLPHRASSAPPPAGESSTFFSRDLTASEIGRLLWSGNPLYLVSAALALYASTILFDTQNIWMETGVPVAILAGYTALCALTANFIVRHGKVWEDARSLLFIVLALPLALSASLDDKVIDRPEVGFVWMAGSLCFVAAVSEYVRRGIGLKLGRWLWIVYYLQLALFFLWPFALSQLLREYPDSKMPVIRGIILFPLLFAVIQLPLLQLVRRKSFSVENGTPWKLLPAVMFGFPAFAALIRTYLLSISFYGGRGVGNYSRMETGFGFWMVLPIVLAATLLFLESAITAQQRHKASVILGGGIFAFFLLGSSLTSEMSSLEWFFFRTVWGEHGSGFAPPMLAAAILTGYAGFRGMHKAWIPAGIALIWFLWLQFGSYLNSGSGSVSPRAILIPGAALVTLGLSAWAWLQRRWWSLLLLLCWVVGATGGYFEPHLPDLPYPFFLGFTAALLLTGWIYRHRILQTAGLIAAVALFVPAVFWCASPGGLLYFCYLTALYLTALLFLLRRFWIPAAIDTLILLIWGSIAVYGWFDLLPWRGAGVIFYSLLFFIAAFLVSLAKAGILQRKFRPLADAIRARLKP